jgi:hypothetical protein
MRKFIITGMAVAMLAVPTAASAADGPYPTTGPGCFGQGRAWAVTQDWDATAPGHSEMGKAASQRAGTNPAVNAAWIAQNCS